MRIYVIDNYDSFIHNIVRYLKTPVVEEVMIVKNDQVNMREIKSFDNILLSPGPGIPKAAGSMMEVIDRYHRTHSMLGICLGHQAIGEYFGWELRRLAEPLHGIATGLNITDRDCLFKDIEDGSAIGHYHSWVLHSREGMPLVTTAVDDEDNLMALRHREYRLFGLQFHPESVLTANGKTILQNWLNQ